MSRSCSLKLRQNPDKDSVSSRGSRSPLSENSSSSSDKDTDDESSEWQSSDAAGANTVKPLSRTRKTASAICAYLYPLSQGENQGSSTGVPRLEALDAPRWIASIQIVLYHFYVDSPVLGLNKYAKWFCVWTQLFFVMSGFVLAYVEMVRPMKNQKLSILRYLRRRLTVIYPAFIFSLLLSVAGCAATIRHTIFEWWTLPLHVVLVQAWWPLCTVNTPEPACSSWVWNGEAWFLSVLVIYWILLRPLAQCFRRKSALFCLTVIFLCWTWSYIYQLFGHENRLACWLGCKEDALCINVIMVAIRAGPAGFFHVFLAGVATARIFVIFAVRDERTRGQVSDDTLHVYLAAQEAPIVLRYGCILGYGSYIALVLISPVDVDEYYYFFHNGGVLPAMLLVLLGAAVGQDPLTVWLFRSRPMLVLGRLSYIQYLMQHDIKRWMDHTFGWDDNPTARTWYLPVLIVFSYVCQRWVERPYTDYQRWRLEKEILGCDDYLIRRVDACIEKGI